MDTINNIELADESVFPDDTILKGVLGDTFTVYLELLELYDKYQLQKEWRYYKDGKAWLCKVQKKKRTVVWMSAWKGYMQVTTYIPLRLLEQVYDLPLSTDTKVRFKGTKNVGKSKPCIFEVRNQDALEDLDTMIQFKMKAR